MNKFIEQANVEFNIEKIKSHIPTIEKYYTTEIENISNDLASQMLEIIRDVSIEYINQVQGKNIDKKDIFFENLNEDFYDALYDPINNVIMYDRKKIEGYIKEGSFIDTLFMFLHEATHYLQIDERYEETFAEGMTKAAEPPMHLINLYNEAVEKVVVPYVNKVQDESFNFEAHKLWFDSIFANKKYNEFLARFYLSNFSPVKVEMKDSQLMPSNIAYRKVYYEQDADDAALTLSTKYINQCFSEMRNKNAIENMVLETLNQESHLSDYREFSQKLLKSRTDFISKIQRLEPKQMLDLIVRLQENDYFQVVEYIIALYYTQENTKKLDTFEKITKNNLQAHLISKSFSGDDLVVLKCIEKALLTKDYNAISSQDAMFSMMEMGTAEQIEVALKIYCENLDLNALFLFFESENEPYIQFKDQLFSKTNKNTMAQLFIKNFLQKLNEIKESENQKELIKLNSKIAYPESVKEIISWLNMPKAEKYIVREQIENLQKTITANFAKLKKEVQPGEE